MTDGSGEPGGTERDRRRRWTRPKAEQPLRPPIQSDVVVVAHAPRAAPNSADDEIVRLLGADVNTGSVTVVTSDAGLAGRVRATGASVQSASSFRALLDDVGRRRAEEA